jgi:hypothetical protein
MESQAVAARRMGRIAANVAKTDQHGFAFSGQAQRDNE